MTNTPEKANAQVPPGDVRPGQDGPHCPNGKRRETMTDPKIALNGQAQQVTNREIFDERKRTTDSTLQGRAIICEDVEPWAEPVDGAEVLDAIAASHRDYVAMPDHLADVCVLWEAHTH